MTKHLDIIASNLRRLARFRQRVARDRDQEWKRNPHRFHRFREIIVNEKAVSPREMELL